MTKKLGCPHPSQFGSIASYIYKGMFGDGWRFYFGLLLSVRPQSVLATRRPPPPVEQI